MKKSVEITIVVICSCIIALAIVGGIFSILNALKYEKIEKSHVGDDSWIDTEEYEYCKLMQDAYGLQFIHTLGIMICSVALMTAVLCWLRLNNEVKFYKLVPVSGAVESPKYFEYKFMNKTLLKIQIPFEIVCLCLGIASYFMIQFSTINDNLMIVVALLLIPQFCALIMIALNIFALTWQYRNTPSVPLHKIKL